ncbi:FtsX-like permease family protein [Hydrogenophaga sp. 5NK40-0174]|uniref:ABC transporter permease n=1 Tax=Hydrogenophaga sp. 5NK40-0174 TaxID=3127649 RepID=UPI003108F987
MGDTELNTVGQRMGALGLGWRTLWRDWRAGELRLLILAVALAVAALTSVAFFADRLQAGLKRDATALIGGDAVVRSDNPPEAEIVALADKLGLRTVQTASFPTMGRATEEDGGAARLVSLKAVGEGYPLRGALRVSPGEGAPDEATTAVPTPGTAWADKALLVALDLKVGQTVLLGNSSFRLDRLLVVEPDRGSGFMTFAPRLMINAADLPATGLVQPASRITYRYAVAGEPPAVKRFVDFVNQGLEARTWRGVRLETLDGGQPVMQQTMARAEKFLNLVALLTALLAAVAVAIAARAFAQRHLDACAMLRVLGVSQSTMARAYAFEFVLVGLVASAVGLLLGYLVHFVFVWLLAEFVATSLPQPGWFPFGIGAAMGLTLMLAFGLPPVLQLAKVPAVRVIRRDVGQLRPASLSVLALGVLGFCVLLLAVSRDLTLGSIAVAGFAIAVLVFAGVAWVAVKVLRRSVNENTASRPVLLATRQLSARPAYAVLQVSSLAVGLLALVLLVLLRTDLIASWREATPPDAPNRFVINVQPYQADEFQTFMRQSGVEKFDWYPMIRGRLVEINGQAIDPDKYEDDRAQRLVEREFNLSYAAGKPEHNDVVKGQWVENESGGISFEEGLAETLGLKLGDQIAFDISGERVEARITSLRKVNWGSLRVNFFAMFPVSDLPDAPTTFISAFRAPDGNDRFDNELVKAFPNITNVDMTLTIGQVQRVLDQVIRAIEFLFSFALVAGLVVLLATVTATRTEREREFAILRAVGAGSALLRQVQRIELLGVGVLAGTMASVVALAVGWALARYAFEFNWQPPLWAPIAGASLGGLLALAAGWWGLRSVLNTPVVETLRKAEA